MDHPSKRKRPNTALRDDDDDDEGLHPGSPTRSTSIWFEDGNVVLQAENLMFRVHKSVLALHSSVLADMFIIVRPEPGSASDSFEDSCPVVEMPGDSGKEWEELLSLIYHGYRKARPNDTLSFTQLSAMLRLGHKYNFATYREEALSRLQDAFGPDWETVIVNETGDINTDRIYMDEAHSWSDVLNLAYDLRLDMTLPLIYYNAIAHKHYPAYLFNGTKSEDGTLSTAYPSIRQHLLCSQDLLFLEMRRTCFSWMFDDSVEPLLGGVCTGRRSACLTALVTAIGKIFTPKPRIDWGLAVWDENFVPGLCKPCSKAAEKSFEEGRDILWGKLPVIFGMKPWDSLKNFDL